MRNLSIVAAALTGLLALSPAYAETTDFFELAKTGTAQSIRNAISRGADINARDKDSWTPRMMASLSNKSPEVITAHLKAGADIKVQTKNGWTPLMFAAGGNQNS